MRSSLRDIRPGTEYGHLFGTAGGGTETVKRDAGLEDTLRVLPKVIRRFAPQSRAIAQELRRAGTRETCEAVWEFCYRHFQYREDERGREQIRSPARSWRDRTEGIDCDCFTVLISTILLNLRIPHMLRVAKYPDPEDPDPPFSHIYVVVPQGSGHITIDPVTHSFDHEVPYKQTKDIKMELEILNGLPGRLAGIDQIDILGATAPQGNKALQLEAAAKARGVSVAEYQRLEREEFIRKNGVTPEQWAAQIKAKIDQAGAQGQATEAATIDKLKAELRKRGVPFDQKATKQQLLDLLGENPATKPAGQVLHAINKANPATVLLRNGLILGMEANLLGVAHKLRWALTTPEQAKKAGISAEDHKILSETWEKLKKIHHGAGGEPAKLMEAILKGRGNKDKAISLSGLRGTPGTLGEPVTAAAAIGAATAAIGAIAMAIKAVKAPAEGAPVKASIAPNASNTPADNNPSGGGSTGPEDPEKEGGGGDDEAKPGLLKRAANWAKENPLPAAGIGVAVVGGAALAINAAMKGGKSKQSLEGTPKGRPKGGKRKARKTTGKQTKGGKPAKGGKKGKHRRIEIK